MKILLALLLALLLPPSLRLQASADRVADASSAQAPDVGDLVLFPLDDVSIPWRDNLKLTLQRPTKYPGNPVLRPGPAEGPDAAQALLYGTVIKEGGKYRMWYLAGARSDPRLPDDARRLDYYRPVAYAESADGIHWAKPNLGLVEFRGNTANNLVQFEPVGGPYARPYDFIAVIRDGDDPDPSRRYKIAYIARDFPRGEMGTATAVSPDGLRWKMVNTNMSITKGHFENTSLIKFGGLFYLGGQNFFPFDGALADGSAAGRVMKVFFSPDFQHWSNGRALAFYRNDYQQTERSYGQEVHMGAGLWNRGNVILGFYGRWHGDTGDRVKRLEAPLGGGLHLDLGFIVSNDAIHYREPVRNFVMVHRGGEHDWDCDALLQANAFANTETQTFAWYSSSFTSRTARDFPPLPAALPANASQKVSSVGLLTLPRDRFGYFSKLLAVSQERNPAFDAKRDASCLSRSLRLKRPSRLSVNVDAVAPGAALTIALVDDAERPLSGYTAQLEQNGLKLPVVWSGGGRELPVDRPFRVRVGWPVEVNQARLYAVYLEHD